MPSSTPAYTTNRARSSRWPHFVDVGERQRTLLDQEAGLRIRGSSPLLIALGQVGHAAHVVFRRVEERRVDLLMLTHALQHQHQQLVLESVCQLFVDGVCNKFQCITYNLLRDKLPPGINEASLFPNMAALRSDLRSLSSFKILLAWSKCSINSVSLALTLGNQLISLFWNLLYVLFQ